MLTRPAASSLAVSYADDRPSLHHAVDPADAEAFVRQVHAELPALGPAAARVAEVRREIAGSGTYRHTAIELEHGARMAWRNSGRCIGRLYWRSLVVRDARHVTSAEIGRASCRERVLLGV